MEPVSLKTLLEAGCHFGHQVNRWHPKAHVFIFQAREGIHIIDLGATKRGLEDAGKYVYELGKAGQTLLFVATKKQARSIVMEAAKDASAPYLTQRWIGGYFTNWDAVKKNIDKLNKMRTDRDAGKWEKFPKHEQVKMGKEVKKLEQIYGGVADLHQLPDAVFVVDIKKEIAAIREAHIRQIPIVAMVDTNADPAEVQYAIPANDDAVGSVRLIVSYVAAAYKEGVEQFKKDKAAQAVKDAQSKPVEKKTETVITEEHVEHIAKVKEAIKEETAVKAVKPAPKKTNAPVRKKK